jgi:hypothetical protein
MNRPTLHSAEKNSPFKINPSGMKSGVGRDEEGPVTNSGLPACWAGLGQVITGIRFIIYVITLRIRNSLVTLIRGYTR